MDYLSLRRALEETNAQLRELEKQRTVLLGTQASMESLTKSLFKEIQRCKLSIASMERELVELKSKLLSLTELPYQKLLNEASVGKRGISTGFNLYHILVVILPAALVAFSFQSRFIFHNALDVSGVHGSPVPLNDYHGMMETITAEEIAEPFGQSLQEVYLEMEDNAAPEVPFTALSEDAQDVIPEQEINLNGEGTELVENEVDVQLPLEIKFQDETNFDYEEEKTIEVKEDAQLPFAMKIQEAILNGPRSMILSLL